jgi:DNA primase
LEQLIESVDIVSAIESYNLPQFRRSGATSPRATALCPFHDDTNPSLQIDGTRRIYKCFSCGAGGNILQFVREYAKVSTGEELSFLKAVQQVNEKFTNGAPLPLTGGLGGSGGSKLTTEDFQALTIQKERILLANAVAAAFYANCLISTNGGAARSHLASRGLMAPTVRAFAIGFAPDAYYGNQVLVESPHNNNNKAWGQGSLVYHLRDSNFTPQEIVDAGLAVRTKRGETSSKNEPPTKLNVQTNVSTANTGNTTSPTVGKISDFLWVKLTCRCRLTFTFDFTC